MQPDRRARGPAPAGSAQRIRRLCGAAIAVGWVLGAAHLANLAVGAAVLDPGGVLLVVGGALLGAVAADAVTGLVHWACDTWGDERTRWLGPTLIYAFREHHLEPRKMLAHDWIVANREPGLAAALAWALLSLPAAQAALAPRPILYAALCSFLVYGAAANQVHLWAHADRPPRPVRWAQRWGLVLNPERHARHHAAPNDVAYCISTGWLNPLLDRAGFWRRLERLISTWTGVPARAGDPDARRLGSG